VSTLEQIQKARAELQEISNLIAQGYGFCPQDGITGFDEDGCCNVCGTDAAGDALTDLAITINHALQA